MLRSRHRRNRVAFAVALTLGILLFCASTEFAARMYVVYTSPDPQPTHIPNSPMAHEMHSLSQQQHLYSSYFVYGDFKGQYYNIVNQIRVTVGQPEQYARTVWLFGNSSTFGQYVSDEDTSSSQLQALLNQHFKWRVVNLGASSSMISGELARLRETPVRPGDVVMLVDGYREIMFNQTPCDLGYYASIALLDLVCRQLGSLAWARIPQDVDRYLNVVSQARSYAITHGATFYHFLQPFVDPTGYTNACYKLMSTDGSIQINVPARYFWDTIHMDKAGERIVAHAMYDALTLI